MRKRPKHYRGWRIATAVGWVSLTACYFVLAPLVGVLAPVTIAATWLCWLWVLLAPALAAVRAATRGLSPRIAGFAALAAIAVALLWIVGGPQPSPKAAYQQHSTELAQLAGAFRSGQLGDSVWLGWPVRLLSVDGRAHRRCWPADGGGQDCVLFLPTRSPRQGDTGFIYAVVRPSPEIMRTVFPGAAKFSLAQVGDGWWWVQPA